jgi:hypothetical protein
MAAEPSISSAGIVTISLYPATEGPRVANARAGGGRARTRTALASATPSSVELELRRVGSTVVVSRPSVIRDSSTAVSPRTMENGGSARLLVPFEAGTSRLGIDVGGVLSQSDTDDVQQRGGGGRGVAIDMQSRPPTAECIAVVSALVRLFGAEHTFIVSKCGDKMRRATVVWLRHFDFLAKTGILPSHVAFCSNRSGIESEGLELSWSPLAAPEEGSLEELCQATGRAADEVRDWFGDGMARVASAAVPLDGIATANCGKGVVARDLRLTHFIDDRAECLHSVFFEGFLAVPPEGAFGQRSCLVALRARERLIALCASRWGALRSG